MEPEKRPPLDRGADESIEELPYRQDWASFDAEMKELDAARTIAQLATGEKEIALSAGGDSPGMAQHAIREVPNAQENPADLGKEFLEALFPDRGSDK